MNYNNINKKNRFASDCQNQNGFSVAEIIIYLAIFTMVSILVINSFITITKSFSITHTNRDLLESGITSMERISREIRQASSIDLIESDLSGGVLQLNSTDKDNNPIIIKFSKESLILNLYQDDILSGNLLGQNIEIDNLIFRRIVTTESEAIKIEMTIHDTNSKTNKSANFYNTIILRGGY